MYRGSPVSGPPQWAGHPNLHQNRDFLQDHNSTISSPISFFQVSLDILTVSEFAIVIWGFLGYKKLETVDSALQIHQNHSNSGNEKPVKIFFAEGV